MKPFTLTNRLPRFTMRFDNTATTLFWACSANAADELWAALNLASLLSDSGGGGGGDYPKSSGVNLSIAIGTIRSMLRPNTG